MPVGALHAEVVRNCGTLLISSSRVDKSGRIFAGPTGLAKLVVISSNQLNCPAKCLFCLSVCLHTINMQMQAALIAYFVLVCLRTIEHANAGSINCLFCSFAVMAI